jgi:hypothetical protein
MIFIYNFKMSTYSFTENKVSFTYQRLLQISDGGDGNPTGIIYDGFGATVTIADENINYLYTTVNNLISTGIAGSTGPTGPAGSQGLIGPTGDIGPQGVTGPTGDIGPQGNTGPQGDKGSTGDIGNQGFQGSTGPAGSGSPGNNDVGVMYLKNNSIPTVVSVQNDRYVVSGTMSVGTLFNFIKDPTTNSLKYIGIGGRFHIIVTFNFYEGNQRSCGFYIGHNTDDTTPLDPNANRISESEIYVNSSNPTNQPVGGAIQTVLDLNTNDRLFFIVQNKDAATNITVEFMKFTVTSLTSEKGSTGAIGSQGLIGPTGSDGLNGETGPQGLTGPQGFTGNQGPQGLIGPTGSDGLNGETGPQGLTGPQGFTGNQGHQGVQGTQGFQGFTGPQGFQGVQGYQGVQGHQGVEGITGPQGLQGEIGIQGTTGPYPFYFQNTTPSGIITNGSFWYHSETGILYVYIDDGDTSQWVTSTGTKGETGPQGTSGDAGSLGPTGPTGPTEDSISIFIDSAPDDISVGKKAFRLIPYNCKVDEWYLISGQTGSIEFDVKKSDFSSYPSTTSIVGLDNPLINSNNKSSNLSVSWSNLQAGDIIEFWVNSNIDIKTIGLFIKISRI